MGLWPVRCAPVGLVAVGSVLWRFRGQLHCTAIVKATFAMPETGEMSRVNPQPLRRSDDYLHGLPSLAGAAEIAPRLGEAGAVVVGHAYSPSPDGVKKRSVRFTIVRGNHLLIDKTLYVYGDRVKGGSPKRFMKMHVGYERALGGLEFSRNPIGVGMDKGTTARPNIIDPKDPKKGVGGYGPVPARFPRRRRKLGQVNPKSLESGVVELPDDFDWEYFQAAPRDQRLERLRGDEWLMLEGMHPRHPRLRVRIPKARGLARIYRKKNVEAPDLVELTCDTLHIEPDFDRCSLVWRADFVVPSELAASALVIAGAVQEGQEAVQWPPTVDALEAIASPAQTGKSLPQAGGGQRLFSTAASPGAEPRGAPPLPPRRQQRTPPPPLPPAPVPPPPAYHKVARPSWNEFPAVEEPPSAIDPASGVVSSEAVSSAMASSGAFPSASFPSAPGSAHGVPTPAPSYPAGAGNDWGQSATQYQAPAHVEAAREAAAREAAAREAAARRAGQPASPNPYATLPAGFSPPTYSPTGTIPAPPPDDEVPDPFHPLERTDEIAGEADHPLERTDPLAAGSEFEDADDRASWESTRVADDDE